MSKVYVVQQVCYKEDGDWKPRHDLTPAEEYGELVFVCDLTINHYNPDAAYSRIQETMEGFKAGDFLLLVGNPILIGLAMICADEKSEGDFSVLQWDRGGRYIPIKISLGS